MQSQMARWLNCSWSSPTDLDAGLNWRVESKHGGHTDPLCDDARYLGPDWAGTRPRLCLTSCCFSHLILSALSSLEGEDRQPQPPSAHRRPYVAFPNPGWYLFGNRFGRSLSAVPHGAEYVIVPLLSLTANISCPDALSQQRSGTESMDPEALFNSTQCCTHGLASQRAWPP